MSHRTQLRGDGMLYPKGQRLAGLDGCKCTVTGWQRPSFQLSKATIAALQSDFNVTHKLKWYPYHPPEQNMNVCQQDDSFVCHTVSDLRGRE